jgi:probable addiction module antidote protein
MNKKTLLKTTGSYEEFLLEQLKDPKEAAAYLEASLDAYEEDGDTAALLLAMRDVAKAQGGIAKLAERTGINREYLYNILANRNKPGLDHMLGILAGLGFRMKLEPRLEPLQARSSRSPQVHISTFSNRGKR